LGFEQGFFREIREGGKPGFRPSNAHMAVQGECPVYNGQHNIGCYVHLGQSFGPDPPEAAHCEH
jgi:hypothetical protein